MDGVLVTGASGFLGRWITTSLETEYELHLADIQPITSVDSTQGIVFHAVDEKQDLADVVESLKPNYVVHCAFINRKPADWSSSRYLHSIVDINTRFFSACAKFGAKTVLISSSAVYGAGISSEPITESTILEPSSLYGLAKKLQEEIATFHSRAEGLELKVVRLFNLCGPNQPVGMIIPDWVSKTVKMSAGELEPVLSVPDKESYRDFVDVRDAASAIHILLRNFTAGEVFNVASGVATSLSEVFDTLNNLSSKNLTLLETRKSRDSTNVLYQRGAIEKIQKYHGWRPQIELRTTLSECWNHYASL